MLTNSEGTEIRIEKEGFAPIIARKGLANMEDGYEPMYYYKDHRKQYSKSIERAIKGYCMFTYLPDDTIVETFGDST